MDQISLAIRHAIVLARFLDVAFNPDPWSLARALILLDLHFDQMDKIMREINLMLDAWEASR